METLKGLAVSRGLASGPAFIYGGEREITVPEYQIPQGGEAAELARYDAARAEIRQQLENLVSELGARTDAESARRPVDRADKESAVLDHDQCAQQDAHASRTGM